MRCDQRPPIPPPALAGVIQLDGASISSDALPQFRSLPAVVKVQTKAGRIFYFQGGSASETAEWFAALSACPGVVSAAGGDGEAGVEAPTSSEAGVSLAVLPAATPPHELASSSASTTVGGAAPRAGPRALDPVTELGVSGDVVAAISALNSEVQTAWEAVLAAALRSRGLEQMQLVERELAQAQTRADGAQIASLTAEVAALQNEVDARRRNDDSDRDGEWIEIQRALAQVEALRSDALRAAEALSAARHRDAEALSAMSFDTEVMLRSLQEVCAASGLPAPAAALPMLERHALTLPPPAPHAKLPPGTGPRPPPNKPPREVLLSQVEHAAPQQGGSAEFASMRDVSSPTHVETVMVSDPTLALLQRACEDEVMGLEGRIGQQGAREVDRLRRALVAHIATADRGIGVKLEASQRKLDIAVAEAGTLSVRVREVERSLLEQRRATEAASIRCTCLEIELLDQTALNEMRAHGVACGSSDELADMPRAAPAAPNYGAIVTTTTDAQALAERTELSLLRERCAALSSDCDAAKVLASHARHEVVRLGLLLKRDVTPGPASVHVEQRAEPARATSSESQPLASAALLMAHGIPAPN